MHDVTLIGGGLSGALLALMLARRGLKVTVYERRADLRSDVIEEGRSINLALSVRGVHALSLIGMADAVIEQSIAMRGRYIHPVSGECALIPYGRKPEEVIRSVGRRSLNAQLLDILAREEGAAIHFRHRCVGYDPRRKTITIRDDNSGREFTQEAPVVIGTDGSASVVRQALMMATRMNYSQEYLAHGYKELTIPPAADGSFQMEPHALHIWPRGGFMMIALPNLDRTFTCTLFLAHDGTPSFENLSNPEDVKAFFQTTFPDAVPLLPDLEREFFHNPTGGLMTVHSAPWHLGGQAILLGDAAHAIVPFFGQGMNCAFEDCACLVELFDQHGGDWSEIFPRVFAARKRNADAIARLALDNFVEMRDTSADPRFALKRKLEHLLEERHPEFHSKYAMVSFHRLPYADALEKGTVQDRILMDVCSRASSLDAIDVDAVFARLQAGA